MISMLRDDAGKQLIFVVVCIDIYCILSDSNSINELLLSSINLVNMSWFIFLLLLNSAAIHALWMAFADH